MPNVEFDGVAISEIVQRVKCELAYAIPDRGGRFPAGDYQWLEYWTAKVDLALETTDTSTLTPSVTAFIPMANVIVPDVGTFARNFTFGAAGKLDGQAYRNDKLSFTIAITELRDVKARQD